MLDTLNKKLSLQIKCQFKFCYYHVRYASDIIPIRTKTDARILFPPKKSRMFTYFYHDVMRLIKDDASFPRACDSWISHAEENAHDWYPLA